MISTIGVEFINLHADSAKYYLDEAHQLALDSKNNQKIYFKKGIEINVAKLPDLLNKSETNLLYSRLLRK